MSCSEKLLLMMEAMMRGENWIFIHCVRLYSPYLGYMVDNVCVCSITIHCMLRWLVTITAKDDPCRIVIAAAQQLKLLADKHCIPLLMAQPRAKDPRQPLLHACVPLSGRRG